MRLVITIKVMKFIKMIYITKMITIISKTDDNQGTAKALPLA